MVEPWILTDTITVLRSGHRGIIDGVKGSQAVGRDQLVTILQRWRDSDFSAVRLGARTCRRHPQP